MATNQTGIFYVDASKDAIRKVFPKQFEHSFFSQLDRKFITILSISGVLLFTLFFILSLRPLPEKMSEKEILKIQERYAKLVLNKPVKKKKVKEVKVKDIGPKEVEKEKIEVDRKNESVEQRQERKAASSEQRQAKRAAISKQIATTGIFAAITATGGSGGGGDAVNDLLGDADGIGDLAEVDLSGGSFAKQNVDVATLKARRGARASGVGLKKGSVGSASGGAVKKQGSIKISSAAPKISGESAGTGSRTQTAINKVVTRQQSRLKKVYETMLKRDPQLGGKIKIKFTIQPDGSVTNVSIVMSTTGNSTFDNRIVSYVKRWKFSPASGGPVEVVYPFVFSGGA